MINSSSLAFVERTVDNVRTGTIRPRRLMIPFEEMQQDGSQRALELVVLLVPHVIELLGNVERIRLGDLAGAQQRGLLDRPAVEVLLVARRPGRLGSVVHGRLQRRLPSRL